MEFKRFNKNNKIWTRSFAAARKHGRAAAAVARHALRADASTLGDDVQVVPATLGDQNLTEREVLNEPLRDSQSLVRHAFLITASEGVVDFN